jgi:hypothetical protein
VGAPKLVDEYCVSYRGVTIIVQRRVSPGFTDDYGYKTSSGVSGIGQSCVHNAERDARNAIDRLLDAAGRVNA